ENTTFSANWRCETERDFRIAEKDGSESGHPGTRYFYCRWSMEVLDRRYFPQENTTFSANWRCETERDFRIAEKDGSESGHPGTRGSNTAILTKS
ncbi:MAG: hypothetical protein IJC33_05365, partial [Clostridia bacterium]|nr:hypothetical protein [Clostridia bacterium]